MSQYRQLSPKSQLKSSQKNFKFNRALQGTPPIYGINSKNSEKVTSASSQRSDGQYQLKSHDFTSSNNFKSEPELENEKQLKDLRSKLAKEEQKNYIYQQFFKKIQKILYSQHSDHLQHEDIKNYEKLQMHLTDMTKRIQKGSQYCKLSAVPVIYKKSNTVTTRNVVSRVPNK